MLAAVLNQPISAVDRSMRARFGFSSLRAHRAGIYQGMVQHFHPCSFSCQPEQLAVDMFVTANQLTHSGPMQDQKTVMSMSRSGAANELLAGPLLYGVIHVMCTVVCCGPKAMR
jgi:hypothetical protein